MKKNKNFLTKISILVPFHFRKVGRGGFKDSLRRLKLCLNSISNSQYFDIFIPTNRNLTFNDRQNINIIDDIQHVTSYAPGLARNNGIKFISSEKIFLMDADLICSLDLCKHLEIKSDKCNKLIENAFEMYPCLYLTKEETERFDGDFQGCLESFLRGENHRVEGIALASSCLLLNREWFLQLGGFDERFVGHGGEDLELIDRLCQHYPIGPRPADYGLNIKAQHPGDYQGFRRYFSYYALPHLFAGRFLVHQWHPRPLTHPYHKRRAGNDALLEQMLANPGPLKGPVIPCNDLNGELPDFREWMIRLQEEAGYPVSEYPGLLRWKDGVTVKRPLWRKMRKLYLNPKAFFKDMVKSKS